MRHQYSTRAAVATGRLRLTVAAVAVVAICASTVPAAVADRGDQGRAFPSQSQVDAARQQATDKARDVGAIKASLMLANQRLEQAAVRAEQASEAYNGAMWALEQATDRAHRARVEAAAAQRTVAGQRDAIGALVATTYQQGSELSALSAMVGADGPEGVLDQYAAFQGASTSLQADYQRFAAADALAQVFEEKAEQARVEQSVLADKARAAKDTATAAAGQAQAAAAQIAAEKRTLIAELAAAQNISVRLAKKRQAALEEIARQRAEARARALAAAAARAQARAEAAAEARAQAAADKAARAEKAARAAKAARAERAAQAAKEAERTRDEAAPADTPPNEPAPAPSPAPTPVAAPSGSGGASAALAYARAQLGEPYRWGAMGPDSWDCSGLVTGAWAAAGVYLPHYSAAQYAAGTPISATDLRTGDLVFWGTTNNPASIHHVAIYIGGGMIIHAPRTGQPVQVSSMYYWIPPNFFARV